MSYDTGFTECWSAEPGGFELEQGICRQGSRDKKCLAVVGAHVAKPEMFVVFRRSHGIPDLRPSRITPSRLQASSIPFSLLPYAFRAPRCSGPTKSIWCSSTYKCNYQLPGFSLSLLGELVVQCNPAAQTDEGNICLSLFLSSLAYGYPLYLRARLSTCFPPCLF